jgi:RNA polymerase sigma-70 factor (ECF subfamily)
LLTAEEQADLVARIQRGDSDAETRFVELFTSAIRAMVRVRTRGALDDQDVSQEVLMAAITAMRRGQLREVERLGAFVAGIARNMINNQLRVHTSRPVEQLVSDDLAVADFREEMSRRERTTMIRAGLAEIRADDRQILLLTLVDGLKSGEIARLLRMNPEVVRQRKSRAIRKLTERLKGS